MIILCGKLDINKKEGEVWNRKNKLLVMNRYMLKDLT